MPSTKQPELSLARFRALVEAYGGDLERFPQRERGAAKALVLRSPEARRLIETARALDALLATARDGGPSLELTRALASIPTRHAQERPRVLPFRSRRLASLSAVAALALGLLTGGLAPAREIDEDSELAEQAEVTALAFSDELFAQLAGEFGAQEGGEP